MAQDRLQSLKAQQDRWMRERQAELDRQRVMEEMQASQGGYASSPHAADYQASTHGSPSRHTLHAPPHQQRSMGATFTGAHASPGPSGPGPPMHMQPSTAAHSAGMLQPGIRPEQVIDKLTERITDRLRSELKVELQRETQDLAAQATATAMTQEAFLAKELENQNTCPICYELMVPPRRAPQLLFPCGHTFCTSCATTHIEEHKRSHCPVCRKKIESRALNYPLQQLILNWVNRRDAGKLGRTGTFGHPPGASGGGGQDGDAGMFGSAPGADGHGSADEIRRRCERLELRLRVLKNELLDVMGEQEALDQRQAAAATVTAHLDDAEKAALAQLAAAQAQLQLVRQQQEQQAAKAAEIAEQMDRMAASRSLLVATISPLEEEHAKLLLLCEGLREQQAT